MDDDVVSLGRVLNHHQDEVLNFLDIMTGSASFGVSDLKRLVTAGHVREHSHDAQDTSIGEQP